MRTGRVADAPTMRLRRQRFKGAGGSAEREFNRQLRQNIRDDWKVWFGCTAGAVGLAVWSFYAERVASRVLAEASGALFGGLLVLVALGGHISAYRWWLGAEGERETAKQIEKLPASWHCEHDLEFSKGNYDHVLVGPAGVFALDSKLLHGTVAAGQDMLRSGRVTYRGSTCRGSSKRLNTRSSCNSARERHGCRAYSSCGATSPRDSTTRKTSSTSTVTALFPGSLPCPNA